MNKIVFTIIAFFFFCSISAQEDTTKYLFGNMGNSNLYYIWVSLYQSSTKLTGVLSEIKDSSIVISNSVSGKDSLKGKFEFSAIEYKSIDIIKLQEKNGGANAALSGGILGFALGAFLGLIFSQDIFQPKPVGTKLLSGGISGGIAGALIGGMTGSAQIVIPINGNFENFKKNKSKLKNYAIKNY
ncbi:MAG: hypothetical protein NTZ33_12250 [Bacteroidetes bacterium]|nr:hypothetical protein [Bacteroidota bacterium]